MQFVVRRVVPLVAIAVVTIAASCEPVKKLPNKDLPASGNIAYYLVEDGGIPDNFAFTRSSSPFEEDVCQASTTRGVAVGGPGGRAGFTSPQASQTLNDDGSVSLDIDFPDGEGGSGCLPISGFAVVVGPIADLTTSLAQEQGDQVVSFLAFDNDGDGDFGGDFVGDKTAGLGNDVVCIPGSGGGAPKAAIADPSTIDDTSEFTCYAEAGSISLTLADLKVGVMGLGEPDVNPDTPVAILVALASEVDANATVDSLTINGIEQL